MKIFCAGFWQDSQEFFHCLKPLEKSSVKKIQERNGFLLKQASISLFILSNMLECHFKYLPYVLIGELVEYYLTVTAISYELCVT